MARKSMYAAIALLSLTLPTCLQNSCFDYYQLPLNPDYGFLGDSILAGGQDSCESVPALLGNKLHEQLVNYSWIGDTVEEIAVKQQLLVTDYPGINTVISNGSANDILKGRNPIQTVLQIIDLFNQVLSQGRDMIFLVQYEFAGPLGTQYNHIVNFVGDWALAICAVTEAECIDLRPIFRNHPEYYVDHVHPSTEGMIAIATAIDDAL